MRRKLVSINNKLKCSLNIFHTSWHWWSEGGKDASLWREPLRKGALRSVLLPSYYLLYLLIVPFFQVTSVPSSTDTNTDGQMPKVCEQHYYPECSKWIIGWYRSQQRKRLRTLLLGNSSRPAYSSPRPLRHQVEETPFISFLLLHRVHSYFDPDDESEKKTLSESAAEYTESHTNKRKYDVVDVVTGAFFLFLLLSWLMFRWRGRVQCVARTGRSVSTLYTM